MKISTYKHAQKFDVQGCTMALFTRAMHHTNWCEFEKRKQEGITLALTMVQCCKDAITFCYNHCDLTMDEYRKMNEFYNEVKEKISAL